jgi:nucleoside-diphosphate-sugar epimerase
VSVVVVTGASGHVGANLVRTLLASGQPVRVLVHHDRRGLEGFDVEVVSGDIEDPDSLCRAFAGADLVYHTAARISILMSDCDRLATVNAIGTHNVVEACLQCGVGRLVHFSTVDALQHDRSGRPLDESRPLVHSHRYPPYARSKAVADRQVRRAIAQGLDAVTLYPSAIIGPHDYRLGYTNLGLLAICQGSLWALIDGGFDWVDVRDVVAGAIQAAARAPAGGRYILSGHWASLYDLAVLANQVNGVRVPRLILPMWVARLGAPFLVTGSLLMGKRPLYTSAALQPLRDNQHSSHARATRELGYQPRPLKETIADTWQWFEGVGRQI